jgi:DNA-binding MarR family transcriptional regulator
MPSLVIKKRRNQLRADIISAISRRPHQTQAQLAKRLKLPCNALSRMLKAMVIVGDLYAREIGSRENQRRRVRTVLAYSTQTKRIDTAAYPAWLHPKPKP